MESRKGSEGAGGGMKPALYVASGILIGSAGLGVANTALDFWTTNYALPGAFKSEVRADKSHIVKARIMAANAVAAQRHGVPLAFMENLTTRESRHRFVKGPQTRWGRAHGPHQILCSTARSLGEPDCNRLMHDADRSADLSARYVRMGFEATGSWHGAAAFYHGGPNTRIWGRKTRAYAAAVSGRDKPFPRTINAYAPPVGNFGVSILPASFIPLSYGAMK
jgi:hypothetical protein